MAASALPEPDFEAHQRGQHIIVCARAPALADQRLGEVEEARGDAGVFMMTPAKVNIGIATRGKERERRRR